MQRHLRHPLCSVLLTAAMLCGAAVARAEDDHPRELVASPATTAAGAAAGAFLAFTQPAAAGAGPATGFATGGYDGARRTGMFEANAEARVWGPLAIRGGGVYTSSNNTFRPTLGARVHLLREGAAGVDGAVGVFYRPEGLTEPEGELEAVVSTGRHLGRMYLLGNLLYGQDPEGNERDGELRLAALRPIGERLVLGVDGRLRADLGSDPAVIAAHGEARFDAFVGPTAAVMVGPLACLLQAGAGVVRLGGKTSAGAFVLAGAAMAF